MVSLFHNKGLALRHYSIHRSHPLQILTWQSSSHEVLVSLDRHFGCDRVGNLHLYSAEFQLSKVKDNKSILAAHVSKLRISHDAE
jgi:hypothetical protein